MMKVVASRRPREAGEIVAAVLVQSEHDHVKEPEPRGDDMAADDGDAGERWH